MSPSAPRTEFTVHRLSVAGMEKAEAIREVFDEALDQLEDICGKDGRDMAICRTKLQEACFWAKRAMAQKGDNQLVVGDGL